MKVKESLIILLLLSSNISYSQETKQYKDTLILTTGEVFVCNIMESGQELGMAKQLNCEYITEDGEVGLRVYSKNLIETIKKWNYSREFLTPYKQVSETYLTYQGIIEIDNTSKNELYVRGRRWFFEVFKNSDKVLEIEDKETGELAGKGILSVYYKYYNNTLEERIQFKITVQFKENKCRFKISDFESTKALYFISRLMPTDPTWKESYYKYKMGKKRAEGMWYEIYNGIENEVSSTIISLIEEMKKSDTDEW